jgi:hypothetical protein
MVSVSRCRQVFFTQSLPWPEMYRLSRILETTPSRNTATVLKELGIIGKEH